MQRRTLLQAGCLSTLNILFGSVSTATDEDPFSGLVPPDFTKPVVQFAEGDQVPTLAAHLENVRSVTGAEDPLVQEIELGLELLKAIPTASGTPFDVAYRFFLWREGRAVWNERVSQITIDRRKYYAREWPVRGNPVIMSFFDATGLREIRGDTTYWCAAFVSWCIARSLGGNDLPAKPWPHRDGAASAAYRNWGQDVIKDLKDTPKKGDVVVFQRKDSSKSYQGHVGFVSSYGNDHVMVLGGNQSAQNERNGGEVNIARFDLPESQSLKLHSFRRHEVLS